MNEDAANPSDSSHAHTVEQQQLQQIRQLLFGAQQDSNNQRFGDLESALQREMNALRTDLSDQSDQIRTLLNEQISELQRHLSEERDGRMQAVAQLTEQAQQLSRQLDERSQRLEERINSAEQTMRSFTLEQTGDVRTELLNKLQSLDEDLQRAVVELSENKTDRSALGNLLQDLASQLTNSTVGQAASDANQSDHSHG